MSDHEFECKECGTVNWVRCDKKRREDGKGTYVPPGTPISLNERRLLDFLRKQDKALTWRQLRPMLNDKGVRYAKGDLENFWGDHDVQRTVSTLTGRGLVRATKVKHYFVYGALSEQSEP